MAYTFVPRRKLSILPLAAELGELYDLEPHELCEPCKTAVIALSSSNFPPVEKLEQRKISKDVGSIGDIRARKGCQLCRLLARSLPEVCPPYAQETVRNEDSVVTLHFAAHSPEEGEEVVVTAGSYYVTTLKTIHSPRPDDFTAATLPYNLEGDPPCRSYNSPSEACVLPARLDFAAVQRWIQECEVEHDCGSKGDRMAIDKHVLPSLLLDVRRKCLVVPDQSCSRYCSLSYVYGTAERFLTSRENLELLKVAGALDLLDSPLPAILQDAMVLTEELGETYLWVDSLCIVHDDKEGLHSAIQAMGEIYRNSLVTFAIASASDATDSIPGVQHGSRHSIPLTEISGKPVYACPVSLHLDLIGSKYESRAWTFQERLLSTRTICFTKNMAYLHCKGILKAEFGDDVISTFTDVNPFHVANPGQKFSHGGMPMPHAKSSWSDYLELVRQYSLKDLTYPSDQLAAFSGILSALSTRHGTTFSEGLPTSALNMSLHWIPGYEKFPSDRNITERREGFPSWSWAGRLGAIEWLDPIICPDWWQWKSIDPSRVKALDAEENAQLSIRSEVTTVDGLTAEATTIHVYTESIMAPGRGLPTPLIKIIDREGRWCGRICHRSADTLNKPDTGRLALILLSTCSARGIFMHSEHEPFNRGDWRYAYDQDAFPINAPLLEDQAAEEGDPTKMCNLLLIEYVGEHAVRRALCQMHSQAWEERYKTEETVILI